MIFILAVTVRIWQQESTKQKLISGLHQTKSEQQTINKMKRQPIEWEKTFTNHTSNEGLISKYTKNTYNSIANKQTNKQTKPQPNLKMFKEADQTFSQKYPNSQQVPEKGLLLLIIREMKLKLQWNINSYLLARLLPKWWDNEFWQGCGEKVTLCTSDRNANWYRHYGKQ